MSYTLNRVSSINVNELNDTWLNQLEKLEEDAGYLQCSVERIIQSCDLAVKGDTDHCLWALCDKGSSMPRAIVEMTNASRSKDPSFKFLNVHVEPALILDYKDDIEATELQELGKIVTYALIESMKLTIDSGTNKLKVFARTQEMISLFDSLLMVQDQKATGLKLSRQGKWLIIEAI